MKKLLQRTLIFLCTLAFSLCVLPNAAMAAGSNIVTIQAEMGFGQTEARSMFQMVNEFRTGSDAWAWDETNTQKVHYNNLPKLQYDYKLEQIAMQRAAEIAVAYSHTRPNGEICFTAFGSYIYSALGENIAAGYSSAAAVFEGWQETNENYDGQGHRRNMLGSSFNVIGIGHVRYDGCDYWVQEFAQTSVPSTSASPANDNTERTSIDILSSSISDISLSCDTTDLFVDVGESRKLPEVTVTAKVSGHWPGRGSCPIVGGYSWSVKDAGFLSLEGDTITGIQPGETVLTAAADSGSLAVHVKIQCTHEWQSLSAADASCTEDGYTEYQCSKCGEKKKDAIPAAGHAWDQGTVTVPATETASGIITYTCTSCGETKTETIPKLDITALPAKKSRIRDDSGAVYTVTKSDLTNGTLSYTVPASTAVCNIKNTTAIAGITYKITGISDKAFKNNKTVKKVTIGKNVKTIGKQAFSGCANLKTIVIKSTSLTAKSVKADAFKNINHAVIKVPKQKSADYTKILKKSGIGRDVKITAI